MKDLFKTFLPFIALGLFTACIPTVPGGNLTPVIVNQFNINMSDQGLAFDEDYNHPSNASIKKYLLIDGDSIKLKFIRSAYVVAREDFSISYKDANLHFQFLTKINPSDPTNPYKNFQPFTANKNITDSLNDTTLVWSNQLNVIGNPNNTYYYETDGFNTGYIDEDLNNRGLYGIAVGDFRYIVFRKLKGISYQYYWIKIRYDAANTITFVPWMINNITILNGNYQMDNIITGQ